MLISAPNANSLPAKSIKIKNPDVNSLTPMHGSSGKGMTLY